MSLPLLSDAVLVQLAALDKSAMPSRCEIFRNPVPLNTTNLRGSTPAAGSFTKISDDPLYCRLVPGTAQGQIPQGQLYTDKIEARTTMTLQIALDDIRDQGLVIAMYDEFTVTTILNLPDGSQKTIVNHWRAKGDPLTASYSTNLPVSVEELD